MGATLSTAAPPAPTLSTKLLCVGLFVAGIAALAVTATMNWNFGESLTDSVTGKQLQGASSLIVDGMAALLALASGYLFSVKKRTFATIVGVIALAFLSFSASNVIGYGASQRVAKAQNAMDASQANTTAAKRSLEDAKGTRTENLSWLRATYLTATTVREKEMLAKQINDASTVVSVSPDAVAKLAMVDPQATVFADMTGMDMRKVQMTQIIILSMLLVVAKFSGLFLSSAMWPTAEAATPAPQPAVVVKTEPQLPKPMRTIDKSDELDLVRQWRDEATQTVSGIGLTVKAEEVFGWFREWCASEHIETSMTQTAFGKHCSTLGIPKKKGGKYVEYPGLKRAA